MGVRTLARKVLAAVTCAAGAFAVIAAAFLSGRRRGRADTARDAADAAALKKEAEIEEADAAGLVDRSARRDDHRRRRDGLVAAFLRRTDDVLGG